MEQHPQGPQPTHSSSFRENNQTLVKALIIAVLILLLMIPSSLIRNLVGERAGRQQEVIREISSKWAGAQTVTGPLLAIPYLATITENGKTITHKKTAYLLPSRLQIDGALQPEFRHRSLYEITLYRAGLSLSGSFSAADLGTLQLDPSRILWQETRLVIGLSDSRGLEDEVMLRWNESSQQLEAGQPVPESLPPALSCPVAWGPDRQATFHIRLRLKGSGYCYFTPVGKSTAVNLHSPWESPAFEGKFLPNSTTGSREKGFTAHWKILQASRPYPQAWAGSAPSVTESAFGVRLLQPADSYAKTERSVKYALLFIALTFTVCFFLELLQKKQIHPLQYFLVGIALVVFYTLLLSLSEYLSFNKAYVISATATVALIGLYVGSLFRKTGTALGFTLALGALYAYIFFIIQLQDYALLFGSIGLFAVVALAMYSSRKVDWYQVVRKPGRRSLQR